MLFTVFKLIRFDEIHAGTASTRFSAIYHDVVTVRSGDIMKMYAGMLFTKLEVRTGKLLPEILIRIEAEG